MSSTPPSMLGKYQIIREIARSNDIVYEAYDPLMDRRVAIKELNIAAGSTPVQVKDRIDRFEREARAAGRLSHQNIMTVYDVDTAQDGNRHFMAMEYLDGQTLRNELDAKGKLDAQDAIRIISDVLLGLEHAHSMGVVHRDIKPDNIQLLSSGQVKITDFGIARLTFQPNITMNGQIFGTPSYMSPEQLKGGELDARSDLFSVGVMLYEMLGGQKPFTGDDFGAISYAILNREPPQPTGCGYGLWRVIQQAIEKTPNMRFASARDMLNQLERSGELDSDPLLSINPYAPTTPPFQLPSPTHYPQHSPQGYVDPNAPPNPYTAFPQSYPQQGHPQGQPPIYLPYPVYTAPKPKPLLTAEQSMAVKRFFMIVLIVGTFLICAFMLIKLVVDQKP